MIGSQAEATAPCRVDLAGGALDVWPLDRLPPGAATVNVAVDRRAWCRAELGGEGVHVETTNTLHKASAASAAALRGSGTVSLVAHVLQALDVHSGARVVARSPVPGGSGLGGSSALAVAVAAAVSAARGETIDADRLWPLLRDAESRRLQRPTGARSYQPALRGGTLALHLEAGQVRVEPLAVDPARVEESLLLVDSRATGPWSTDGGDAIEGRASSDDRVPEALGALTAVAQGVRKALVEGRFEDVIELLAAEWDARKRLAPSVTTSEIDRVVEVVRAAGGAALPSGAGGGSVVAVWAPPGARGPGRREAVLAALTSAGLRVFPARVDLRGLEVS